MSAPKKKIRGWYVSQVLDSFVRLTELLSELTEDEVLAALHLESQSRRRRSIMDRLVSRAVRLNELKYAETLRLKFQSA